MALRLAFINLVLPLKLIHERLGQDVFDDLITVAGDTAWQDNYLVRFGCMNEIDLNTLLNEWEGKGVELIETVNGQKYWKDLCVVFSGNGPSYPCRWIKYDPVKNIIWRKDRRPGKTAGPATNK